MYYKKGRKTMLYITNDTISTIRTQKDGSAVLTVYFEKKVLHEKTYKTFTAAKAQETRLLKHYDLLVRNNK